MHNHLILWWYMHTYIRTFIHSPAVLHSVFSPARSVLHHHSRLSTISQQAKTCGELQFIPVWWVKKMGGGYTNFLMGIIVVVILKSMLAPLPNNQWGWRWQRVFGHCSAAKGRKIWDIFTNKAVIVCESLERFVRSLLPERRSKVVLQLSSFSKCQSRTYVSLITNWIFSTIALCLILVILISLIAGLIFLIIHPFQLFNSNTHTHIYIYI